MARRHEAEMHLKAGMSPIQIAARMGVSIRTVIPYLLIQVGDGDVSLSEICFSIPTDKRLKYDSILDNEDDYGKRVRACRTQGLDSDECHLYKLCRGAVTSDMYSNLATLEINLHDFVRRTLEREFSHHDDEWWTEGVPLQIRQSCQMRREEDHQRLEAYAYTNLIHLKEIIEKKWNIFKGALPPELARDKTAFLRDFSRLNEIRNSIMHPIKMVQPTKDDFDFVQQFRLALKRGRQP